MGSITSIHEQMKPAMEQTNISLQEAIAQVKDDPSNPMYLAELQAATNEASVVQSVSATVIKKFADTCSLILSKV